MFPGFPALGICCSSGQHGSESTWPILGIAVEEYNAHCLRPFHLHEVMQTVAHELCHAIFFAFACWGPGPCSAARKRKCDLDAPGGHGEIWVGLVQAVEQVVRSWSRWATEDPLTLHIFGHRQPNPYTSTLSMINFVERYVQLVFAQRKRNLNAADQSRPDGLPALPGQTVSHLSGPHPGRNPGHPQITPGSTAEQALSRIRPEEYQAWWQACWQAWWQAREGWFEDNYPRKQYMRPTLFFQPPPGLPWPIPQPDVLPVLPAFFHAFEDSCGAFLFMMSEGYPNILKLTEELQEAARELFVEQEIQKDLPEGHPDKSSEYAVELREAMMRSRQKVAWELWLCDAKFELKPI